MDDPRSDDDEELPPHGGQAWGFDALVGRLDVQSVGQAEDFERGLRHLRQIRRRFDDPFARPHTAARPCPACRTTDAVVIEKGDRRTVRCARCRRLLDEAATTPQPATDGADRRARPGCLLARRDPGDGRRTQPS